MYWEQTAVNGVSSEIGIKKGVRLGVLLSSNFYNLYEKIFREIEDMPVVVILRSKYKYCKICR